MSLIGPGRKAACKFGRIQQFLQIDARVEAHAFQKIDEIFRREISAGAGAIRTTAKAGGGGVKLADPCFEPSQRVGQTSTVGVVEMKYEILSCHFQFT